ncbi:hypothetical protein MKW92_036910 [Papaver armeniacum]|nr:hypothetical protein MKW92_036910 [Papaver armeniacum]
MCSNNSWSKRRKICDPSYVLESPRVHDSTEKAEEVYGFRQKGIIRLPCDVDEFLDVQSLIEQETMSPTWSPHHHNHHQHHNNPHHHHHFLHGCCLKKAFEGCFQGLIRLM